MELEQRVALLRGTIAERDPRAPDDWRLHREVDEVISVFYDDIGTIKSISLRSLFELFLVKVLYVDRGGRDLAVLDYLADMLMRFLWTRELVRFNQRYDFLYTLLQEIQERQKFQNLFEASRHLADNALFVTGVFPRAQPGRRRRRMPAPPRFDRQHFVEMGRRYYRIAAEEELAGVVGQRAVLSKLSEHFVFYMETLTEMSQRYILGFDVDILADKMLDAFNRYRRTGDEADLEVARRYAALIKIDRSFPGLNRYRRVHILGLSPD